VTITSEEFARWRDDLVTQWVFASLAKTADDNKELWLERSWGAGVADQQTLTELRTRADAYRAIIDAPYRAHCHTLGEEPSEDAS
jgi:hypothetical protein